MTPIATRLIHQVRLPTYTVSSISLNKGWRGSGRPAHGPLPGIAGHVGFSAMIWAKLMVRCRCAVLSKRIRDGGRREDERVGPPVSGVSVYIDCATSYGPAPSHARLAIGCRRFGVRACECQQYIPDPITSRSGLVAATWDRTLLLSRPCAWQVSSGTPVRRRAPKPVP